MNRPILQPEASSCVVPRETEPPGDLLQKRFAWLAVVLAFGQFLLTSHMMNPDGISYLEVGEAWLKGDFRNAINGYWNPVYPVLLASVAKLFPRSFEFFSTHLVNFLVFLALQQVFHWFLREVRSVLAREQKARGQEGLLVLFAYPVFLWSTLVVADLGKVTPDLLVALAFTGAATAMLRIYARPFEAKDYLLVGLFLGVGYLCKTVVFVLAFGVLFCMLLIRRPLGRSFGYTTLAGAVFLLVAAPHIALLSSVKGRLTYGDSGPLAYAWEVNRVSPYFHWQGEQPGFGKPKHPPRELSQNPPIYEFANAPRGSYPLWYDPSFWNDGLRPMFRVKDQLKAIAKGALIYWAMIKDPVMVAAAMVLIAAGWNSGRSFLKELVRLWFLWLPLLAPFALYALVYAEARYVAVFISLLAPILFLVATRARTNLSAPIFNAFAVVTLLFILAAWLETGARLRFGSQWKREQRNLATAQFLVQNGIKPGDPIAVMGQGVWAFYAHLAQARIVAEASTFHEKPGWIHDPVERIAVEKTLEALRVRAIVLEEKVANLDTNVWQVVPGGEYAVKILSKSP